MDTERRCLYCNLILGDEWARKNQKYCNVNCKTSHWYRKKYKTYYDAQYQKKKKAWERSPNGKRAGIAIREWLKLPKDWR